MEEEAKNPLLKYQKPILALLGLIIGLGILSLVGILAFNLGRSQLALPSPTPTPQETTLPIPEISPSPISTPKPTPTFTPTPTPTPTPSPSPSPSPTPTPMADLYISKYSFDHPPKQGEPFTVTIGISNKGNKDAGSFWWEWKATWAITACRQRIDSLGAGSEKTVTCTYTYGGWANYETKAVADANNEVPESDEGNNTYIQNVVPIH